jgi:hypothetical protein
MSADMTFYLVAVPAIVLFGLSKGGFAGQLALDADAGASHLACEGGGDRAADPHRPGLGERAGEEGDAFGRGRAAKSIHSRRPSIV